MAAVRQPIEGVGPQNAPDRFQTAPRHHARSRYFPEFPRCSRSARSNPRTQLRPIRTESESTLHDPLSLKLGVSEVPCVGSRGVCELEGQGEVLVYVFTQN